MQTKQALIDGRAVIADPAKWGKGHFRWNNCYCAVGAVAEVTGCFDHTGGIVLDGFEVKSAITALADALPPAVKMHAIFRGAHPDFASVARYNDHADTTHADVLALYDRAIEAAL